MTAPGVRLVVGVTGHRRLADAPRLAANIDAALDEITSTGLSATGPATAIRLVVLSPLAEGAERLVAERALARDGAELEAVLPMSEADYERDFETDGSRAEFRSLLAHAKSVHRLPVAASREEAYAAAGRFVVDHCDVLIAVWDGRTANGPGGTADTIAYARSLARPFCLIKP